MSVPKILETYLDGLDALTDGRGFDASHEKARVYVECAVRNATIWRDALETIAMGNMDPDAMVDLARAALSS